MKRFSYLLPLIGWFALCLSSAAAEQAAEDKLMVGVLQSGGTIIPFARFDGTGWTNTWPGPLEPQSTQPSSMTQVPPEWLGGESLPANWRIWLPAGSVHETRILGLEYSKTNCAENWGLGTDFPKALNVCRDCCPDSLTGVALSTDRPMLTMQPADRSELPFAALERAFTESEAREIAKLNSMRPAGFPYYGPPLDSTVRAAVPLRVERAWLVHTNSGDTLYYVEANKKYPNLNGSVDTGCPHVSAFRGWLARNSNLQERAIDSRVEYTDCDFKSAGFTTPMGLLEFKNGRYVIVQNNEWESQSYGILKIESGSVISVIETAVR